jgi:predicted transcriptional regulator
MTESRLSHAEPREPVVGDVLGPLGAAVMRVLWDRGSASVGTVVDALNAERRRPLAYTTVMTVMSRLFERDLLERDKQGRQYVYRPVADEPALIETLSGQAVDELLARYGTTALRQFAHRLADSDPDLRAQILELAARRSR